MRKSCDKVVEYTANQATKEKANLYNRQFRSAFTHQDDSEKGTSPFPPMGDITVDPKRVSKLLDGLNVHKEPGPDGLNARVLKECSNEISPILALNFNESLARGDVPDEWRQANVSPVFKKGEKYDAANYRQVSLTCICCKTLEHILVTYSNSDNCDNKDFLKIAIFFIIKKSTEKLIPLEK